jgi:hypothetical protein
MLAELGQHLFGLSMRGSRGILVRSGSSSDWDAADELASWSDEYVSATGSALLVPRKHRGLRRPPGVVIHSRPDDESVGTLWRGGMPITTPARTLVDVAVDLQPEQAAMAEQQALAQGLLTRRQLEREAARQGKTHVLKILLPDQ